MSEDIAILTTLDVLEPEPVLTSTLAAPLADLTTVTPALTVTEAILVTSDATVIDATMGDSFITAPLEPMDPVLTVPITTVEPVLTEVVFAEPIEAIAIEPIEIMAVEPLFVNPDLISIVDTSGTIEATTIQATEITTDVVIEPILAPVVTTVVLDTLPEVEWDLTESYMEDSADSEASDGPYLMTLDVLGSTALEPTAAAEPLEAIELATFAEPILAEPIPVVAIDPIEMAEPVILPEL